MLRIHTLGTLCRGVLMVDEYNYSVFDMQREVAPFESFPDNLHVGQRAPSFELEGLNDGSAVALKDLWRDGFLVVEFGSFT